MNTYMIDITYRRPTIKDTDTLFELVNLFATSFVSDKTAFQISFENLINDASCFMYVAEIEGNLIGYCLGFEHYTFYANGKVAWLEEIMVKEEYRLHGIGRRLLDEFEQWSLLKGSSLIGLATRRAANFYSALGYEESATFFRKLLKE